MTPKCWDSFKQYFTERGYSCIAPAWPHKNLSVEQLQSQPPGELAKLGIREIVEHYAQIIRQLPEPPILIGHSFGGLFVQLLLDRGLGKAGIALDSAPPKGILPFYWSVIRSNAGVLLKWAGWRKVVRISQKDFAYSFVHTLPKEAQEAVYREHVVPETGRIFFQAAYSPVTPNAANKINFRNGTRAPLLLIAGSQDHIIPAAMVKTNYHKYRKSEAVTEFKEFPGRTHWLIAQDGWAEIADYIHNWLSRQVAPTFANAKSV
jgi:pimeloyl-ACP methyl ester carboxylesterase